MGNPEDDLMQPSILEGEYFRNWIQDTCHANGIFRAGSKSSPIYVSDIDFINYKSFMCCCTAWSEERMNKTEYISISGNAHASPNQLTYIVHPFGTEVTWHNGDFVNCFIYMPSYERSINKPSDHFKIFMQGKHLCATRRDMSNIGITEFVIIHENSFDIKEWRFLREDEKEANRKLFEKIADERRKRTNV